MSRLSIAGNNDPALLSQRAQITQTEMSPQAIEWMFICFAHDLDFFAEARELMAPHHFKPHESPLRLVYEAMCISVDNYHGLTYESLASVVADLVKQNNTVTLTPEQITGIMREHTGLLAQICSPGQVDFNDTNKALARELLRRFAHERTVVEPLRRVLNPGVNQGVPEIGTFLDVIDTQRAKLSTLNQVPVVSVAPEIGEQLVASNVFRATNIDFLDGPLQGQRQGDCNGLIGPTGGGKTTLAIQMAVAMAKQCWTEARVHNTEPETVVFISAEESAIKLRPRVWSAFFNIPRTKLETLTSWDDLTQPGQLDPYELQMQHAQTRKLCELERYKLNMPQLSQCFQLIDISGSDEYPDAGNGYIPEIVSYLARLNRKIHSVFIDYAGIVCERHMQANGDNDTNIYRRLLKNMGDHCRKQISERFNCTTWLLHQARGDAGKASAFRLMHHTDAGETKDFAVNMAVCLCLGVPDPHTGCRRLNPSKVRYRPNEAVPPVTLRINDRFAYMENVTNQYIADESNRRFVLAEDASAVHGTEGLSQRNPQTGGPAGLRDTSEPIDPSQRVDV